MSVAKSHARAIVPSLQAPHAPVASADKYNCGERALYCGERGNTKERSFAAIRKSALLRPKSALLPAIERSIAAAKERSIADKAPATERSIAASALLPARESSIALKGRSMRRKSALLPP